MIGAIDKVAACKELNVSIFIDDQLNQCINLAKNGICTIRFSNSNEKYKEFVSISNWKDVYSYILNIKEEDIK